MGLSTKSVLVNETLKANFRNQGTIMSQNNDLVFFFLILSLGLKIRISYPFSTEIPF